MVIQRNDCGAQHNPAVCPADPVSTHPQLRKCGRQHPWCWPSCWPRGCRPKLLAWDVEFQSSRRRGSKHCPLTHTLFFLQPTAKGRENATLSLRGFPYSLPRGGRAFLALVLRSSCHRQPGSPTAIKASIRCTNSRITPKNCLWIARVRRLCAFPPCDSARSSL